MTKKGFKFKVGDRVLINGDSRIGWNDHGEMDITIGKIGIVKHVETTTSCQVEFDEGITRRLGWYYQRENLTLATDVRTVPDELFRM